MKELHHMTIQRQTIEVSDPQIKYVKWRINKRRLPRKMKKRLQKRGFNYHLFRMGLWFPQCFGTGFYENILNFENKNK